MSKLIKIEKDSIMETSIRVVQEWYKETSKNALQDALTEERYYGKIEVPNKQDLKQPKKY